MAVYTVFEPPQRRGRAAAQRAAAERAERFVFLRDGFSWGAFLFGPLWLLYRRLWLALIGYLIVFAALEFGLQVVRVGFGVQVLAGVLIELLVGFEAPKTWTITPGGLQTVTIHPRTYVTYMPTVSMLY